MQPFDFLANVPAIMPEIGLAILAVIVLSADIGFIGIVKPLAESRKGYIAYIAAFGMFIVSIFPIIWAPDPARATDFVWGGMIRHDMLAQFFKVTVILGGAITCLMATGSSTLARKGEFYLIIVVATLGASLLSASVDLIMIFVALETVTIPLYILAAFSREDRRSSESSMKYFLFGSFSSAILLYGFSLLYGFTGNTNIYEIAAFLSSGAFLDNAAPVLVSLVLIFVGFAFKISAVPFHFWTPDVYEGSPAAVTGYVSVASKAASFALMVRFLMAVFPSTLVLNNIAVKDYWILFVSVSAVLSMTIGNILALQQKNIKRLLAYSSIAQAGYTMIGVAALQGGATDGVASVAFYLFMYTFTNLLAFAVIVIFSEQTGSENIKDLAGLSRRNPWVALAMTIAFLSLAGIPPAAGFFGKFFLFNAAVDANLTWLALVGVINSIVALYYYLVVIKVMYVDRSADEDKPLKVSVPYAWLLAATSLAVLVLGVIPQAIYDWAVQGASSLLS